MKRRHFLKVSTLAIGASVLGTNESLANMASSAPATAGDANDSAPLINSKPMLQNFAETSIGVAFSVSALANGFVVYGKKKDLSDGKKVWCGGYRIMDMNDQVMQVRLTGLEPATTYYYRIGANRMHYGGGYDMKILETVEDDVIYSFKTAGRDAQSHFCVINDTHAHFDSFDLLTEKICQLAPSCVVWNGDGCNAEDTFEEQKEIFLYPPIKHRDYASQMPYLLCPGNHDGRGKANRHLEKTWMFRQPEERSSRDWDLGRNFAVRLGDIALVGLDTAEDKLDSNPAFANLYNSHAYREAQAAWLKDALDRPEIKNAQYIVALCHIPLYDSDSKHNPGDVAPADYDPRYDTDYAMWQRTCKELWSPLLEKAGCKLLICAHTHEFRVDKPSKDHSWTQVVGAGPDLDSGVTEHQPAVIDVRLNGGKLHIDVHNVVQNKIIYSLDI